MTFFDENGSENAPSMGIAMTIEQKYIELRQEPLKTVRRHIIMSKQYDIALLRITKHHHFDNQISLAFRFLIKQEAEALGVWDE